jgi:hypothetical protein
MKRKRASTGLPEARGGESLASSTTQSSRSAAEDRGHTFDSLFAERHRPRRDASALSWTIEILCRPAGGYETLGRARLLIARSVDFAEALARLKGAGGKVNTSAGMKPVG